MIQGTCSNAGKTILTAGLCRLLKRRGLRVAPFKPQNMSLNSAVTTDGGEIGRGQALQAFAAGVEPHSDMNPVLLKPSSETGSQVIVQGRVRTSMDARQYHQYKPHLLKAVIESFERLSCAFDVVLVEGAGSPAEINLRSGDIANMGFAREADLPVLLVGDIDRGGIFAQFVGTLEILKQTADHNLLKGFVINRFRGEQSLLKPAIDWLENETSLPVLGTVPFVSDLVLEAEDSLSQRVSSSEDFKRKTNNRMTRQNSFNVVALRFPGVSNSTDMDPLFCHDFVGFSWLERVEQFNGCDLLILPGSKNVRRDLGWLRERGFEALIERHLRLNGSVMGICGGYQMLGREVHDPYGVDGEPGSFEGLGYLDVVTNMQREKVLTRVRGQLAFSERVFLSGYEIHKGHTTGRGLERPFARLERPEGGELLDGSVSECGRVFGTYLHGLFEEAAVVRSLCRHVAPAVVSGISDTRSFDGVRERSLEKLADTLESSIDMSYFEELIHGRSFERIRF